jgi:hypothetical protein
MYDVGGFPMTRMTKVEIREALKQDGIEVTFRCDYTPSSRPDKAIYDDIEFSERAWASFLLAATNRRKKSRNEALPALSRDSKSDPAVRDSS